MDKLIIEGPCQLSGEIKVSSAKNAILPILAATLLTDEKIIFDRLPDLRDVKTMTQLLARLGAEVNCTDEYVEISAKNISMLQAPYELVKTMRASILVLGPLLARYGQCQVSLPGGCAIGTRPIDIHLSAFEQMGAVIKIESGYVMAKADKLRGAKLTLPFPSVGATENIMMAACLAIGSTTINNAAREPEIVELARFLSSLGANISGAGESIITIQGDQLLKNTKTHKRFKIMGDRIEASTYIIAALMTRSHLKISGFQTTSISAILDILECAGAKIIRGENFVEVFPISAVQPFHLETAPYPGLPTDVQAQFLALATQAKGTSIITEKIFENRFMHVPELMRLGAKIRINQNAAIIQGPSQLQGAQVMCTDLRASAALVLAALAAKGQTVIERVYHLDRGYEQLDKKLSEAGAIIYRK